MSGFAIKIDRKLKANLYKICRLCGMDYPDMVPILSDDKPQPANEDEAVDVEKEPEMSQKINVLIGLLITKDDRMPQTMCTLCVDKINDFYEFREMCYATYEQTRKLLGLKNIVKKTVVVEPKPKVEVKEEPPVVPPSVPNKLLNRKRKAEVETAPVVVAAPVVSNKKLRLAAASLKEAATKKAKLKGKESRESKEEEKDVAVKEEGREVVTRKMKLMKEKEAKEAIKEEAKETAVKEESKETTTTASSKKDGKEKLSKKEHKDNKETAAPKKDKELLTLKKDSKEVATAKKDSKETVATKKDNKEAAVTKKDSKETASNKKDNKEAVSNKKDNKEATATKKDCKEALSSTKKNKHKAKEAKQEEDVPVKDEIKEEVKEEPTTATASTPAATATPNPTAKHKHGCNICTERFATKGKLEAHLRLHHIPKIERYVCTACNETISKSFDIKNHQLWHKLSKTPYVCGLCGESIVSTYAYARHLHEHSIETPAAFLVLDRECPQCHVTYATNFLYNTHPCAVKTRRCAGCNRLQRSETEYVRHSALCIKSYLNYSKHIAPAVEAQEDEVRIKNENEVEAAAEEMARISGLPLELTPVVQLTRLSSPLLMTPNNRVCVANIEDSPTTSGSGSKKSGKKGVSKKELRRVDELLKSTLDALVSIKHEPEVHVEPEVTPGGGEASDDEAAGDHNMDDGFQNDYHHNEESDPEDGNAENSANKEEEEPKIQIKQEIEENNTDAGQTESAEGGLNKSCGFGLKLKIRKEHGQLNSSIIEQEAVDKKEKRKKKKKHKDKEKDKQKTPKEHGEEQNSRDSLNTQNHVTETGTAAGANTTVHIKTEPLDAMETDEPTPAINSILNRPQPEATIMTSIPIMQLQISCISEGVEFNAANVTGAGGNLSSSEDHLNNHQQHNISSEQEDVKPNREELDRMLKITHVSGGNDIMAPTAAPTLQITNVTGGIPMETDETKEHATDMEHDHHDDEGEEEEEDEHEEEENEPDNQLHKKSPLKSTHKATTPSEKLPTLKTKLTLKVSTPPAKTSTPNKSRNKACKSTAKTNNPPPLPVLQISAVQSGVTLPPASAPAEEQNDFVPIFIKPEPQNRGYADEEPVPPSPDRTSTTTPSPTPSPASSPIRSNNEEPATPNFTAEEQAYISTIDFNNITIKQEKDLEINDVQIKPKKQVRSRNYSLNGIKKRKVHKEHSLSAGNHDEHEEYNEASEVNEDEDVTDMEEEEDHVDNESEAVDEAEEEDDDEEEEVDEDGEEEEEEDEEDEEEEEREYRELEYPPELSETNAPQEDDEEETDLSDNENNTDIGEGDDEEAAKSNETPSNIDEDNEDDDAEETSHISDNEEMPDQDEANKEDVPQKADDENEPNDVKPLPKFVIANICSNAPGQMSQETPTISIDNEANPSAVIHIKQEKPDYDDVAPASPAIEEEQHLEPQQQPETMPILKIASVASGSLDLSKHFPIETESPLVSQENVMVKMENHMETNQDIDDFQGPNQSLTEITTTETLDNSIMPMEISSVEHDGHVEKHQQQQMHLPQLTPTTTQPTSSEERTSELPTQTETPMEITTNSIQNETNNCEILVAMTGVVDSTTGITEPILNPTGLSENMEVNGVPNEMVNPACSLNNERLLTTIQISKENENPILPQLAPTATQIPNQIENPMLPQFAPTAIQIPNQNENPMFPQIDPTAIQVSNQNENPMLAQIDPTAIQVPNQIENPILPQLDPSTVKVSNQTENSMLPQLASSQSAFDIASIKSLPPDECEDTITGVVSQKDDLKLEARPITVTQGNCNSDNSLNQTVIPPGMEEDYDDEENIDEEPETDAEMPLEEESSLNLTNLEEQQNLQNLEQQEQQFSTTTTSQLTETTTMRPTALALHPYLEDISSSSNSFLSNALSQTPPPTLQTSSNSSLSAMDTIVSGSRNLNITHPQQNNEETENILNESNDMLNRRVDGSGVGYVMPSSSSSHHPAAAFNFDNINEIAENNNNANIEREQLQDDQQQQQRHQHQTPSSDDVT
ncbi:uncharacterized protein [Musca autumnalis]|uniref:uncharacterized protein n=1 Tax=Musca autumnalis TaxID=221902 RepID=UPI003CEF38F1